MHLRVTLSGAISFFVLSGMMYCRAQEYSTPAPDGTAGATFSQGCVTSRFFDFTFRVPSGMSFDDMSNAPNGGKDSTGLNFVIFMAHRDHGLNRDVINVAAEDRRSKSDPSAASWMRALHQLNTSRSDVPVQGEVESIPVGDQQVSRLRFQQSRNDGVITYEAAYAVGVRGYVVYFIFGSIDQAVLTSMEKSMDSFSTKIGACSLVKPAH